MDSKFTRRNFVKTSALATGTLVTGTTITSCTQSNHNQPLKAEIFPLFHHPDYLPADGVSGLLFSQIGYLPDYPVRIIIRLPKKELLSGNSLCRLVPVISGKKLETPVKYWGEIWKSHWWIAEFKGISEGEWNVEIHDNGALVFQDSGLKVQKDILWKSTVELAAADMLERRVHFTKVGAGWQDAGTLWVESPAQSAMIIALSELAEKSADHIDELLRNRIYRQMEVGCDYLVMSQQKARELGFPDGSMSHDLLGHEKDVLPNDAVKAVIALSRSARLLPETFSAKKGIYQAAAQKAFQWLTTSAQPVGDRGLSRFQRGLAENVVIPKNEWQTRDMVSLCWASVEQWKNNEPLAKELAIHYAGEIMARQIHDEKPENGFYGHFIEYPSMPHSEKSWIHGIVNNQFGADIGGIYPNYLVPLVEMLRLWPDNEDVEKWKQTLHRFTYGYLIPACELNPFLLLPQGIFGEEGPVWFCGTFHGTNAIYGYTAALALELADLFNEPRLKNIAYGNLQWLAGLNGGITKENLEACVIYSTDIPEGLALPVSMMCGVGKRWAGTWFQTRGVICNGFSTGKQFVYDTEPIKANDGPFSLTDEDWIPHSASWLTGLIRMISTRGSSRFLKSILFPLTFLLYSVSLSAQPWETHGNLMVSKSNPHYIQYEDDTPFFWLGDTGWEMLHRLNREETETYLENRRTKGFNVIQTVIISEFIHMDKPVNYYGDSIFEQENPELPLIMQGRDPKDEKEYDYWDHVDYAIMTAESKGLYLALLPSWGEWVVPRTDKPLFNTKEQAYHYGWFLGNRYRKSPNLIWILGGDRQPDERDSGIELWRAMAEGIADGVNGQENQDGKADYSTTLMTYHSFNSSSKWFHNDPWIDFDMWGSYHAEINNVRSYIQAIADWNLPDPKPTLNGEPCYEGHGVNYAIDDNGYFTSTDVRLAAYWSVFSGAAGFTYGAQPVWQFTDSIRKKHSPKTLNSWQDGLDLPGAFQVVLLKKLMESRPMHNLVPDQSLILRGQGECASYACVIRGKTHIFVYVPTGNTLSIKMGIIPGEKIRASWFDPRNGDITLIGEIDNNGEQSFDVPGMSKELAWLKSGRGCDWVLILDTIK
jgi:hypothetical protein